MEKYYTRSYSNGEIRAKVMEELNLKTYNIDTVASDIKIILNEWREARLQDMDSMRDKQYRETEAVKRECWNMHETSKARGEDGNLHALSEVRSNNQHEANIFGLTRNAPSLEIVGDGITVNLVDSPEAREVKDIWDNEIEDIG